MVKEYLISEDNNFAENDEYDFEFFKTEKTSDVEDIHFLEEAKNLGFIILEDSRGTLYVQCDDQQDLIFLVRQTKSDIEWLYDGDFYRVYEIKTCNEDEYTI